MLPVMLVAVPDNANLDPRSILEDRLSTMCALALLLVGVLGAAAEGKLQVMDAGCTEKFSHARIKVRVLTRDNTNYLKDGARGFGIDLWDPGGHYFSTSIVFSFFFKIWDPGQSLSLAIMLRLSIPSHAGLMAGWGLQVQPAMVLSVRKSQQGKLEVLTQWQGMPDFESSWESAEDIKLSFPSFHLEDKVVVQEGGIVRDQVPKGFKGSMGKHNSELGVNIVGSIV